MRITVCELPHEAEALAEAWAALCEHTVANESELVLLPELAMAEPIWELERFDAARWTNVEAVNGDHLGRLPELRTEYAVGTRPARLNGSRLNQGYLWSAAGGMRPLRNKYFLPEEPGSWEATWFQRGDPTFPVFHAGAASFGLNICTELWALETYAAYAALGVELVLSPRATALETTEMWLAAGVVAAVRSGAFCLSSNRVDPTGRCGGGGWIIDPAGDVLALTSAAEPFATREVELTRAATAKRSYPRYVLARGDRGEPSERAVPTPQSSFGAG
ncbi:MAG TPA: carbon-nitrogen hydrolase family protein [Thermoanaerobaculia bacterium]|nr:carbon-nitrogen hydrolase family protein [Thermoanaerobaculia bacterium]